MASRFKTQTQRINVWELFWKLLPTLLETYRNTLSEVSTDLFPLSEVQVAISDLRRNKAGGLDNILPELYLDDGIALANKN